MNAPADNPESQYATLLTELSPLVRSYLTEVNSPATLEEFLKELTVVPIRWKGQLSGFWGLKIRRNSRGVLAAIKAAYILPSLRGPLFGKFVDILMDGLARRGVTHIEIWAFPGVERWLRRRYKFVPRMHIIQTPIEAFLNFDRDALQRELDE